MENIELLRDYPLFYRLEKEEIAKILTCFSFKQKKYNKDEYILLEGYPVQTIGIIIHGTVLMEKSDILGNHCFLTELREHEIFAEPFMGFAVQPSFVNYKAMDHCSILFFNYKDMWQPCEYNCTCHSIFTENLMNLLAMKTRTLLAKIEILSKKSIRERILTFINLLQHNNHIMGIKDNFTHPDLKNNQIFIPYNHTELAEYLGVNRSAFVRELKKMKDEGIIDYNKNVYTLPQ